MKDSALALSARYFEARCLENLDRKDEARDVYQQVIAVDNPNPFRDDSRLAVGSIFLAAGRKGDALKQFEALANEASKPALKAEATVRAGLVALDLAQSVPSDKAMSNKATTLLKKGAPFPRPDAGAGLPRSVCSGSNFRPAITRRRSLITKRAKTTSRKRSGPR